VVVRKNADDGLVHWPEAAEAQALKVDSFHALMAKCRLELHPTQKTPGVHCPRDRIAEERIRNVQFRPFSDIAFRPARSRRSRDQHTVLFASNPPAVQFLLGAEVMRLDDQGLGASGHQTQNTTKITWITLRTFGLSLAYCQPSGSIPSYGFLQFKYYGTILSLGPVILAPINIQSYAFGTG